MRERKKTKGMKSGDAGPVVVPLYEVMDFLSETIRHKRLLLISACMCTDIINNISTALLLIFLKRKFQSRHKLFQESL